MANSSKATTSSTSSSRPQDKNHECGFKIVGGYDKEHDQWYIRKNAGHCLVHNDHLPVDIDKMEQGKRNVKKEVLKDAEELLLRNVPKSVVQELIQLKTGHKLTSASIAKIKQTMVVDRFKNGENESNAETMIRMMEEDPDIEFCAYYGTYSEAEKLVRVRKQSRTKKKKYKKRKPAKTSQMKSAARSIGETKEPVIEQKTKVLEEIKGLASTGGMSDKTDTKSDVEIEEKEECEST